MILMPKHDHHKAATQLAEAAGLQRKAGAAKEPGDTEQASQHTPIANAHSSKAQQESNPAHRKTKGPKKL